MGMRWIGTGATRFVGFVLAALVAASVANAQSWEALGAKFDASGFSAAERRVLQIGLVIDAGYLGLIDGRWGAASQAAFEIHAAQTGGISPDDLQAGPPMLHAAVLAADAIGFLVDHDVGYRGGPAFGHRLLTPAGPFTTDSRGGHATHVLRASGLEITLFVADLRIAAVAHAAYAGGLRRGSDPYLLRRETRLVTAGGDPGRRIYARSDATAANGAWVTTLIAEKPGADPRLFDVIAASITTDAEADIDVADGPLVALTLAAADLARDIEAGDLAEHAMPTPPDRVRVAAYPDRDRDASPAPAPPFVAGITDLSSGTAFFVNPTELVTAAHVVVGCTEVTFEDGAPLEVIALHATLDLALLRTARRSEDFLPLAGPRRPRLGEGVFALGYPLYGTLGTGLSMTRGNISATFGLGDDPTRLTITAPIHPGNSGGPLMSLRGEIVGVVVATIDKVRVAEAFGALPENINFAVAGEELAAFLDAQGATYSTGATMPLEDGGGAPDAMQAAVAPVLCWTDLD